MVLAERCVLLSAEILKSQGKYSEAATILIKMTSEVGTAPSYPRRDAGVMSLPSCEPLDDLCRLPAAGLGPAQCSAAGAGGSLLY